MGYMLFDAIVDWIGLILCPVELFLAVLVVVCLYKGFVDARPGPGPKLPLEHGVLVALLVLFFLCLCGGIGGLANFLANRLGAPDIKDECFSLILSAVFLVGSAWLFVFEVKALRGRFGRQSQT